MSYGQAVLDGQTTPAGYGDGIFSRRTSRAGVARPADKFCRSELGSCRRTGCATNDVSALGKRSVLALGAGERHHAMASGISFTLFGTKQLVAGCAGRQFACLN